MNARQFTIATMLVAGFLLSCSLISSPTLIPISRPSPVELFTSSPPSSNTISPATSNPLNDNGSTLIASKDSMKLIFVPAGEFLMGNDNGAEDERPAHSIYLDSFWIDETEVTNAMYKLCVQDGFCKQPFETIYYSDPEFVENPVNYVFWEDAKTYCSWADRRLPTEAEWEKVASWDSNNQTKRIYPWGETIDCSFANYYSEDGCIGYPSKVGSYPSGVSPYGALDMAGNVMELGIRLL